MDKLLLKRFGVVDGVLNNEGVLFANRDGEVFAENAELLVCPNGLTVGDENGFGVAPKPPVEGLANGFAGRFV